MPNTGDAVRQGQAPKRPARYALVQRPAALAHPSPAPDGFATRGSRRGTPSAPVADASHGTRSHDRGIPAGSNRSPARRNRWTRLSNAPDAKAARRHFRVTHPFHPMFGHEHDLINYTHCWGEDRVFYVDEAGQIRALPARWTSAAADDPFVVVSAGRSHFRVADLLELVSLVRGARR